MLGLAFEGCACRAAFHVGVAAALTEARVPVALTAGSSSGSIVATGLAAGLGAALPALWRRLADRPIVSWRRVLWNRSIFDMSHLVATALRDNLGAGDLRAAPGEALVTLTRLGRDGLRTEVVSSRAVPDVVPVILGSCFFPVFYGRPVHVGGAWALDGGIADNLPLDALAARGCDEVVAVVTSERGTTKKRPWIRRWRPRVAGARLTVLHPRRRLDVRSWDLGRDKMERAIDEGYAVGREFAGG